MNTAEFKTVMAQLADYFGEKHFTPKMQTVIWRIVQKITRQEFEQVVNNLVEESPRPPTPAAIRKQAAGYIRAADLAWRNAEVKKLEESTERCLACGGSGYVLALCRANPNQKYSFACHQCQAPKIRGFKVVQGPSNDPKAVRQWDDSLKEKFVPVSFRAESVTKASALQQSSNEARVCLSWLKRLKENSHALKSFVDENGIIPDYLRRFLQEKGLEFYLPPSQTQPTIQIEETPF